MFVSILVPAHNEASNIQTVLRSLLDQETSHARIIEIVVVASGCTDDTADQARKVARGRPGVHVHVQERRGGKVAAINEYLRVRNPRADIAVICSADLRVAPDVIEKLIRCYEASPEVGMVGARPVPDNATTDTVGKMVQLLWEMHHRVATIHPKMGELVSFRANLIERVSELSVVDEASVEDIVRSQGYELAYVGDAVVQNHGPEKIDEYFEQRRRIARGHYWLDFAFGYQVATLDQSLLLRVAYDMFREEDAFGKRALGAAIATEIVARMAGFIDARILGGKHRTWKQLRSTKRLKSILPAPGATTIMPSVPPPPRVPQVADGARK